MTVSDTDLMLRSLDANWDYERWQRLPDDGNRYEVIDGILYMTMSPSFFHQWIILQALYLVGFPAQQRGLAYPMIAPIGVLMPGCDPVQPDFLLVRQERAGIIRDRRIYGAPDLIMEVLSPSNPEHDLDLKRHIYARAGLLEYWIVRPATRDVLVYWEPNPVSGDFTQVRLIPADGELVSPTLPLRLTIADLFAGAPDTTL